MYNVLTVEHNSAERMFTISDMNGKKSHQYYRSMEFYCHPDFISAEYSEECWAEDLFNELKNEFAGVSDASVKTVIERMRPYFSETLMKDWHNLRD